MCMSQVGPLLVDGSAALRRRVYVVEGYKAEAQDETICLRARPGPDRQPEPELILLAGKVDRGRIDAEIARPYNGNGREKSIE